MSLISGIKRLQSIRRRRGVQPAAWCGWLLQGKTLGWTLPQLKSASQSVTEPRAGAGSAGAGKAVGAGSDGWLKIEEVGDVSSEITTATVSSDHHFKHTHELVSRNSVNPKSFLWKMGTEPLYAEGMCREAPWELAFKAVPSCELWGFL